MIVVSPEHEPLGFWLGSFEQALEAGFVPTEVFICSKGPVRFTALLTIATVDCLARFPLFRRCAAEPLEATIARVWPEPYLWAE